MPLSVPTWIAAVATAVIAAGVIAAAVVARRALAAHLGQLTAQHELTAQLAQATGLQIQHLRLTLDERRRAQACQVFLDLDRTGESLEHVVGEVIGEMLGSEDSGFGAGSVTATVRNTSQQPVHDLYLIWQLGTNRMGKPDRAPRLLPGQEVSFGRAPDGEQEGPAAGAESLTAFLTFRDAAGVRWTVREDGTLSDISPSHD